MARQNGLVLVAEGAVVKVAMVILLGLARNLVLEVALVQVRAPALRERTSSVLDLGIGYTTGTYGNN